MSLGVNADGDFISHTTVRVPISRANVEGSAKTSVGQSKVATQRANEKVNSGSTTNGVFQNTLRTEIMLK